MSEFLIVSSTFAREPLLAIPLVFGLLVALRRAVPAAERHRLRRAARAAPRRSKASYVPLFAHLALVLVAGHLSAARRWSPGSSTWRGCSDRRGNGAAHRHRQDRPQGGEAIVPGRAPSSTRDGWQRALRAARRRRPRRCSACGATADAVHMALLEERRARSRCSPLPAPTAASRRSARMHPPAIRLERAIRDLFGLEPTGASDARPWLDHGRWGVTPSARQAAQARDRSRRLTRSCRSKGEACTRSRSARCMPASSSPAISASPPTARRWCGSRSGSAMCTRASRR